MIFAALGYGAHRSALEKQTVAVKAQTAQIVNAVVNPASPAAEKTAESAQVHLESVKACKPATENAAEKQ